VADEKIVIDTSQALAEIAKLKGGLIDVQAQATKAGKATSEAFDTGAAQGVADAVDDLQKEYADLKRSADVLKTALKSATDPKVVDLYVKSIVQLDTGMAKLEKTAKQAGVSLKEVQKGAGTGKQVFEGFFGTFTKATLIVSALVAVKQFVVGAVQLSQQIQAAKKSFEAFTGSAAEADKIVNNLIATGQKKFIPTDEILEAGKALLAFGENADNLPDVLGRIADVSAATGKNFNELTTIYGKARASGVLYAEDINQLVDAGIPIIQEFASQMGVSNDQVKKLASEGKISFEELQLAMFNLTAEGGKFAGQAEVQSSSVAGAWKKLVSTVQPAIETVGDAISSFVQGALEGLTSVIQEGINMFSDVPDTPVELKVEYTGRDAYEQEKDDRYERERLEKEADKARRERNKANASEAAKAEKDRQNAIIASMKDGEEKEIAIENLRYRELLKQLRRYHIDAKEATEQHELNLQEIQQRASDRANELLKFAMEARRAIYEQDEKNAQAAEQRKQDKLKADVDGINTLKNLKDQEIDIQEQAGISIINTLKANGASEKQIKAAELELDKEIQKARLQNELEFQLALLDTVNNGDEKRIQEVLNNIDLIRAKISNLDVGGSEKKSLLERLGFTDDEIKGLDKAAREVIGILQDITAANVQQAEEKLQIAQDAVDEAEEALEKEIELKEAGFASDVDLREKELQKAKDDEARALAQKRAAQRAQLALDSALQLSSLVTSAANIIKGFSSIPFVGTALGIAAVAAMFAAFASTKARAFAATKLKHGGQGKVDNNSIIVGASHDDGGVGIEAEGGEFFGTDGKRFGVVNKRMTAKHFDLLDAINRDDRRAMASALAHLTTGIDRDAVSRSVSMGGGSHQTDSGNLYGLVSDWRNENRNKKSVTVEGDYRVERRGSTTKKVKIK